MDPIAVVGERPCLLAKYSVFIEFLMLGHGVSWDSDGILFLLYRIMHVLRKRLVSTGERS